MKMLSEFERLTEKDEKGNYRLKYTMGLACGTFWYCPTDLSCHAKRCDLAIAINKLAAYEDSGMKPEEVMRMKEREKKRRIQYRKKE